MAWKLLAGISSGNCSISAPLDISNYLNNEQSQQDGQPIELYLFNRADIEYWSYTSSDLNIYYNGKNYEAVLIKRSNIRLNSNALKTSIEIEVNLSNPFVQNFISEPIEGIIQLIIYRQHFNSYVTYWKGYVGGVAFKGKTVVIFVGLKTSSLKRLGLMRKYQRNCGLPLYSKWCTISKDNTSYKVSGIINSVNGVTIDATVFGTKPNGWFLGGIFKTNNGNCLQRIAYHNETIIKIARPVSALTALDTFVAWAGCDHLKATCKTKFFNKLNYGGQPYIPDKNPFIGDPII